MRWALFEAAKNSSHQVAPDHDYYAKVKNAHDGKIAAIRSPASWPGAAITPCGPSTPRSSTPWPDRTDILTARAPAGTARNKHQGLAVESSRHRRVRQPSCWTAFKH